MRLILPYPIDSTMAERAPAVAPDMLLLCERGTFVDTKPLGNSSLNITPVGVGAWAMGGGGWQWAWGPQDDQHSIEAIARALDHGVNWIDTAAV